MTYAGSQPHVADGGWCDPWSRTFGYSRRERCGPTLQEASPGSRAQTETRARLPKVACRFHDLRHSAVTRLLEAGVSFPIVASLLGWSPSTTTKMAKRYGHIGGAAHREAVAALDPSTNASRSGTKDGTRPEESETAEAVSA